MEKIISEEFPGGGVRDLERGGKTLRLHYHVLLDVQVDVRTGYDFEASRAIQAANPKAKWELHKSANPHLRRVHDRLKAIARRAGFGTIFHCEPIRSEIEAIKTYLAKYITKHVGQRLLVDKGRRLVGYFGLAAQQREIPSANGFAFGGALTQVVGGIERPHYRNAWAWLWRTKLEKYWAARGIYDMDKVSEIAGPKWCFRHAAAIREVKLSYYPYMFMAVMDERLSRDETEGEGISLMSKDVTFGETKTRPFVGIRLRSEEQILANGLFVNGSPAPGRSADILKRVAEKPAVWRPETESTVVWSDGRVERREVVDTEVIPTQREDLQPSSL